MRRVWPLALLLMITGCATVPERAYYANPADPETRVLAEALWRAAKAARDDPGEYSFAMIRTGKVSAYTVEDATFYFTQGLARQPAKIIDALVGAARLVAVAGRRLHRARHRDPRRRG